MHFRPFKEAGLSAELYTNQNADNTKVLVWAGVGNIWKLFVENPHTAATFIQFFDKATTGAVTLGTTVADFSLLLPIGGNVQLDLNHIPVKNFQLGCVIAVTSTRTGSTAPGANANVNIWYKS